MSIQPLENADDSLVATDQSIVTTGGRYANCLIVCFIENNTDTSATLRMQPLENAHDSILSTNQSTATTGN